MLDTGNARPIEARVRVIYGDTDQMGVVYYANYFRYFELSRSEWFRAHGGSYIEMEKSGLLLPVVEAQCSYRASARYEDLLVIKAWVATLRRASLTFEYEIRKEGDETILVTGQTTHACITKEGRPTRLPPLVMELFRK
jgi:acyl-CoA thioester hydrolase